MIPHCIVVIGPESSGTRILTRMFVEAGYFGSYEHKQRIDDVILQKDSFERITGNKPFVLRRSVPHGRTFPDIKLITELVSGFNVFWFITYRDWYSIVRSKIKRGHETQLERSYVCMREQMEFIEKYTYLMQPNMYIDMSFFFKKPKYFIDLINKVTGILIPDKCLDMIYNPDIEYERDRYKLLTIRG